mgnify:CR=1 FL=1
MYRVIGTGTVGDAAGVVGNAVGAGGDRDGPTWQDPLGVSTHLTGASRGDCLQLALVLYRELSRAGDNPVLVVGLRQDAGRTLGHAWVEVEGVPIVESVDGQIQDQQHDALGAR